MAGTSAGLPLAAGRGCGAANPPSAVSERAPGNWPSPAAAGGPPVSARVESADEAARVARAHWELGGAGLLLGRAPDEPLADVEPLIEEALLAARSGSITGQAVTPFVLSYLHRESGGRTLRANKDLIAQNARLAGEIAVAG